MVQFLSLTVYNKLLRQRNNTFVRV